WSPPSAPTRGLVRDAALLSYTTLFRSEQGVATLQQEDGSIRSLRGVNLDMLWKNKEKLDDVIFRRCKFVVDENSRVLQACRDLRSEEHTSELQSRFALVCRLLLETKNK